MRLKHETLMAAAGEAGYRITHEVQKVIELTVQTKILYLVTGSSEVHLVIPEHLATNIPSEIRIGDRAGYHNSNLRTFPRRKNNGRTPIHFGISIKPETALDMTRFLVWFRG